MESDFEIVLAHLDGASMKTARELSVVLQKGDHSEFKSKRVNQVLYRLLNAGLVERRVIGGKPRWKLPDKVTSSSVGTYPVPAAIPQRPLKDRPHDRERTFVVASTPVKVIQDSSLSANDPYLIPDWVGTHVVASVNVQHLFWATRIVSESDRSLFLMLAAVDAYVQWQCAKMVVQPTFQDFSRLKSRALQHCSLASTDAAKTD